MKRVLVVLIALMMTASLFSADTATLTLYGAVSTVLNIDVTQTAGTAGTPLNLNAEIPSSSPLTVATVSEKSNSPTGYQVSVTGTFEFENGTPGDNIPFAVHYDGVQVASSGQVVVNEAGKSNGSTAKELAISYNAIPADQTVGTYTSTVTLEITAN